MKGFIVRAIFLASGVVCFSVSAVPVSSAEERGNSILEMSLEELMNIPVQVASKSAATLKKNNSLVTVITKEDIRRAGYRTLTEALRRVSGIFVKSNWVYDKVNIRGSESSLNPRILFLVDGHRMNDWNYDEALLGEEAGISLEDVERIEVLKGPGSAAWGTEALIGVIQVITVKGQDAPGVNVSGEYGDPGRSRGYFRWAGVDPSGLDWVMSSAVLNAEGENRIHFPGADGGYTSSTGLDGSFGNYQLGKVKYGDLALEFLRSDHTQHVPYALYGTILNDRGLTYRDQSLRLDLAYDTDLNSMTRDRFLLRTFYDRVDFDGHYPYADEMGDREMWISTGRSQARGLETRYTRPIMAQSSMDLGFEYQDVDQQKISYFRDFPAYLEGTQGSEPFSVFSAYIESSLELTEGLSADIGYRFDHFSSKGAANSPRFGLTWSATTGGTLRLSYGRAFRAPNNAERNDADNVTSLPNRNLTREQMRSAEISWQQRITADTQASLALFESKISDIIVSGTTPDGLIQSMNAGEITYRGAEFRLDSRWSAGLAAYTGLTAARTRQSDSADLQSSPQLTASAGVSLPIFDPALFAAPEVYCTSAAHGVKGNSNPSYCIADFNLVKTFSEIPWAKSADLALGVFNIFNADGLTPADDSADFDSYPAPRRSMRLKLEGRW